MITTLSADWPEPSKIGPVFHAKEAILEETDDSHSNRNSITQLERERLREG